VSKGWNPTSPDAIFRRNAGRRRYNATRHLAMVIRREKVAELLVEYGDVHGARARIARELGVSAATVTADVQALLDTHASCPCCGSFVPREWIGAGGDDGEGLR
jgi:hypothetical protein